MAGAKSTAIKGGLNLFKSLLAPRDELTAIRSAGRTAHEQEAAIRAARNAQAAEQMAKLPPRSKKANEAAGLYHPVGGGIKLSRPTSGMSATTVADPKFKPPNIGIITPERLVKEEAALFPLIGDRAAAGRYLTHVGENELATPVRLTGGPRYMDANYNPITPEESAAWESGLGRVTALGRQAGRAGKGGRPVYGIYTAGSGTNTDFNIMGANALIQQIPFGKITKKAEKEFDRAMREGTKEFPPIPDWPGIRSPEAQTMLLDKSKGIVRTKLFGTMGKENFQSMGFPDVPATRKAIIEPELLDAPTNQAGFRLARMDATGRVIENPTIPSDYPTAMAGQVAGKLDVPADYKDVFQSHFDARRLMSQPESGDYYSFSRVHPIQYADDAWLNRLMEQRLATERKIKEGEYKEGGEVDIDAADARLEAALGNRMAKGGEVDLDAADARLNAAVTRHMSGGGAVKGVVKIGKELFKPAEKPGYKEISGMVSKVGEAGRSPIVPVPNRWFLQPEKFPNQQKLIERVLERTGKRREEFPSGAFIDPRTGEVLDSRIVSELGVVVDPATNRPMMSSKGSSGIEQLDPKIGAYTKSNLVRKGLFKPEGGDPLLNELNFLATIEKGDVGHKYGLATEYASPAELWNTGTGANPTLRPRSRGDLFGVGDVVGTVRVGRSEPHKVYEKLFVAPKGSDVQGVKLSKANGGLAMADGGVAHMAAGGLKAIYNVGKAGKQVISGAEKGVPTRGMPRKFGEETGGLGIVKEPGGNWLTGSVEKSLENLKRSDRATGGRQNPKESMAEMKATYTPEALKTMSPETRRFVEAAFKDLEKKIALNNWVDRNLTNYVKKQMATKDDPVRKLAEENIIHVPSSEIGEGLYHAPRNRAELGQPQLGQSAAAKAWEDATDTAINVRDIAGLHKSFKEPWMENAPAGTKVSNVVSRNLDNLGFDHIMDVLRADVRAGRIRPEQLNKISMEQAVRRVHEHDQELARKMAEAQIKATESMPTHKEYKEGYKWIELSEPKDLPTGWRQDTSGEYIGPAGERTSVNPSRKSLEDALKHEGETMGHCVGSYCDDVAGGKSRIYSLRDVKNAPHVTIEVRPQKANDPSKGLSQNAQVPQNLMDEYEKAFRESGAHSMNYSTNFWPWLQQSNPEEFARLTAELPPKIVQIKGKQNLAPKEEYLPFVQDFVRSGKWSEVGDLRNTGLVPIDEASDLAAALKSAGKDVPPYVSQSELTNLLKWNRNEGDLPSGFANGGGAFKTLQWKNPQNFNGGGAANAGKPSIGQRLREYEPLLTDTRLSDIKKNAAELWEKGKGQLEEEYKQFGRKGGPKDFAIRASSNLLGGVPDILNLGLEAVDLAAAYTPGLGRPESVMDVEGSRVPIVSLASEKPWLGSQQFIEKAKEAKLLGKNEFPISEIAAGILGPVAVISALRKGKKAYTGAKNLPENKRRGGLAATSQ